MGVAELTRKSVGGELYWQRPGPQTTILAGNTWSQLGVALRYFWDLVDPTWFKPGLRFEGGSIKGQRLAIFDVIGGPGAGGELRCGTFKAENLAGPRADTVITDEPLPVEVYDELWARLLGRNGRMYQTFTPTLGTAHKIDYLWDMVDDPLQPWAGEIQTELTLGAVTPRGGLLEIPWMTQREIDEFEAGCSAASRDCRMGRTRRPSMESAVYSSWGEHLILSEPPSWLARAIARGQEVRVGIGIDHGSKPGAERTVLVYALGRGIHTRIWVVDEHYSDGRSETADDAKGLLAMLDRQGLRLDQVDQWVGDRAHRGDRRGGKKSNQRLQQAVAELMGIDTRQFGWIRRLPEPFQKMHTPAKRDGSVYEGADIIHELMTRGRDYYAVSSACKQLDKDHSNWKGGATESAKDGCDAERYIIVPMVEGRMY